MTQTRRPGPLLAERGEDRQAIQRALNAILVQGDYTSLPEFADSLARRLRKVRVHQVRRLFGEVQRIEMLRTRSPEDARRRLLMLRPRIAYQTARQKDLQPLKEMVDEAVPLVHEEMEERFERFYELVEAVVAYHGAYGKD